MDKIFLTSLILYICGSIVLIPMGSLMIKQYVRINSLPQGMVYFDNTTEYILDGSKSVRIKTYGYLYGETSKTFYNVTIAYPPDTSDLTSSLYDVNKYVKHIKNTTNEEAHIDTNSDNLSFTVNIRNIGGWVAAIIIFALLYTVVLIYVFYVGMILSFNELVKLIKKCCGSNENVIRWLPAGDIVYYDPTPNIGWTMTNRNLTTYNENSYNLHALNTVNQSV